LAVPQRQPKRNNPHEFTTPDTPPPAAPHHNFADVSPVHFELNDSDDSDEVRGGAAPAEQAVENNEHLSDAQQIAVAGVRLTKHKKDPGAMNTARRLKYAEKKLVRVALSSGSDKLLASAASTPSGRRLMPCIAAAMGTNEHFQAMARNTAELLKKCGGKNEREFGHLLTEGLPFRFCKKELAINQNKFSYYKRREKSFEPKRDRNGYKAPKENLADQKYAAHVKRCKISEPEEVLLTMFFVRTTYQASGAETTTRIQGMPKWEWDMHLHADYPMQLRALAQEYPDVVPDKHNTWTKKTKFVANMLSALHAAEQKDFDLTAERKRRGIEWKKNYVRELAVKNGTLPKFTQAELAMRKKKTTDRKLAREPNAAFDPATYAVEGVTGAAFRLFLVRHNLRYTHFAMPHPCPLCDNGDTDTLVYNALLAERAECRKDSLPWPGEKEQSLKEFKLKVKLYRLHVKQLEVGRKETKKLENNLKVGECMVIRDFVNHHDHGGSHVKCLHWVLMWRDVAGADVKILKLRHYCSDPDTMMTDVFFTADVMDFHLNPDNAHNPGLFDNFHKVYFVGDHGPHFAAADTLYNESTAHKKYGKEIVLMYYTSYHAYGRADSAGAQDSVCLRQDLKAGMPRHGARAFTAMTNNSNDKRSWAYLFPKINRNTDIFPEGVNAKGKYLRKWSEVIFEYDGRTADFVGVCLYRWFTGVGVWNWCDLLQGSREEGQIVCESCSTLTQTLVFHTVAECDNPGNPHIMPDFVDTDPDPGRIDEAKQKKPPRRRGQKESTMVSCTLGCTTKGGRKQAFRSAANANTHYRQFHGLSGDAYKKVAYKDDAPADTGSSSDIQGQALCAGADAGQAANSEVPPKKKNPDKWNRKSLRRQTNPPTAMTNSTMKTRQKNSRKS
jgi:hypothetical protein